MMGCDFDPHRPEQGIGALPFCFARFVRAKLGRKMGAKRGLRGQNPAKASGSEHWIGKT